MVNGNSVVEHEENCLDCLRREEKKEKLRKEITKLQLRLKELREENERCFNENGY